jgi:hypothetical protein
VAKIMRIVDDRANGRHDMTHPRVCRCLWIEFLAQFTHELGRNVCDSHRAKLGQDWNEIPSIRFARLVEKHSISECELGRRLRLGILA